MTTVVAGASAPIPAIVRILSDHTEYAGILKRLTGLRLEFVSLGAEAHQLDAALMDRTLPNNADRELAELPGRPDGDSQTLKKKFDRRETVRARAALIARAIEAQEEFILPYLRAPARKVMAAAVPEYQRLLAVHAHAIVAAARTFAAAPGYCERVQEKTAAGSQVGLPFHGFRGPLESGRQEGDSVCLWLKELQELGAINK